MKSLCYERELYEPGLVRRELGGRAWLDGLAKDDDEEGGEKSGHRTK